MPMLYNASGRLWKAVDGNGVLRYTLASGNPLRGAEKV